MLIPPDRVIFRAFAALFATEIMFKIIDYRRQVRVTGSPPLGFRDFLWFLVPFPPLLVVFSDKLRAGNFLQVLFESLTRFAAQRGILTKNIEFFEFAVLSKIGNRGSGSLACGGGGSEHIRIELTSSDTGRFGVRVDRNHFRDVFFANGENGHETIRTGGNDLGASGRSSFTIIDEKSTTPAAPKPSSTPARPSSAA